MSRILASFFTFVMSVLLTIPAFAQVEEGIPEVAGSPEAGWFRLVVILAAVVLVAVIAAAIIGYVKRKSK